VRLGDFELLEVLGRGAMGSVFRARHVSGAAVAVKVLDREDPMQDALFRDEVRAVAALDHPNIVQVHDHGRAPTGRPWLAMELVEAGALDLRERPWPEVERVLADLLDGLAHAHARGVLHRDLKPDNVLMAEAARLADFGLAGRLGAAYGSPAYMAPEQVDADPEAQGPWTDLYALGCLGWALCCGAPPFFGSAEEVLGAQVFDELPPFSPRVEVPERVEPWLRRCLEKEPADRWAFAAHARRAISELPPRSPRPRSMAIGLGLYGLRRVPLVGRVELRQRLREVAEGEGLRRWVLYGGAGAGKSRLAEELAFEVHERGLARVFRAVHGPTGGPADGLVPMLGLEPGMKQVERHARVTASLREVGSALVLLDDLQWGPDALAWAQGLEDLDLFVLATARNDLMDAPEGFERLDVEALAGAGHRSLVDSLLGLAGPLAERIAERTRGNPLFAVRLVADWVRRGVLVASDEGLVLAEGASVDLPDDLHALFSGRIAEPAVELAAVLGEHVDRGEWAAACAAASLDDALPDELFDENLAVNAGDHWRFAHGLVRESLVRSAQEAGRLVGWHNACAVAVEEPERRARHLLGAGRRDEALDSFLAALTRRVTTGDFDLLEALSEEVAALCEPDDPRLGRVLAHRVRADLGRGRHHLAKGRAEALLERTLEHDWPLAEAHARLDLGRIERQQGRHDNAWEHLLRGEKRALDAGDTDLACRMVETRGWVLLDRGDTTAAREHFQRALEGFQAHHNDLGEAVTQLALAGVDMKKGKTEGILWRLDRAAELYGKHNDRWGLGSVAVEAGEYHRLRGELDEADRRYAEGHARYSEIGSSMAAIAQLNLGLVRVERGAWSEAVEVFEDAERELERQGRRAYLAAVHAGLLACAAATGDLEEFDRRLVSAEQCVADTGFADPDLARLGQRAAEAAEGERADRARAFVADQWRRLGQSS